MNSVYIILLVCIFHERCMSANVDDVCDNNDACTVSESECMKDYTNCGKGFCKCKTGYTANSGKTVCLKDTKLDVACADATEFCLYGAECNSGTSKCACAAGKTYNSILKLCITIGEKAITEECTQTSDCYLNAGGTVECVVKSGSSSSTKYCTCKAGYETENNVCRKPHVSESCTTTVGCDKHQDLGSSQGQEDETCTSDTCSCPSTADQVTRTSGDNMYKLCLTKYSDKKSKGATCTSSNQCSSTYCGSCPGETDKICLSPKTTESSAMMMKGSVLMILVCITTYLL